MKRIIAVIGCAGLIWAGSLTAVMGMSHGGGGEGSSSTMNGGKEMNHGSGMDHGTSMEGMEHGSGSQDGTFKHMAMAGDVHAEFQVMDLASMNMKDPEGNTHHVMATFMRDGKKLENIVGKVKLVSPSGKEQISPLKDFGSGIFAANFTIDEPGKWGVISLFKDDKGQHSVKFWYPHMEM